MTEAFHAIIEYLDALARLQTGRPINVLSGIRFTNDSVALEARRAKGDDLAAQFSKKTFFKDVTKLDGSLKGTFQEFGNAMQSNPVLGGMKTELPSVRVYTTAEMANKSGSQYYFLQGGK